MCSVWGADDFQFPQSTLDTFSQALDTAGVPSDMKVYDGVGHAFIKLDEVRAGKRPQRDAWDQCVAFLRGHFEDK